MPRPSFNHDIDPIAAYWDAHPLGRQYVRDEDIAPGTASYFDHIRPWMGINKFPWIRDRLEREAALLEGKHLLEVGCGMGFDSVEFLRRGVRVTATDLTRTAVELSRRHFVVEGLQPEDVRIENVRSLSFSDNTFDAVWARGVLHATGDAREALAEIRRVLKPGGRAIISHFYRRPSWMYWISRLGRQKIEFEDEDPPVNDFLTERQILELFEGYRILETAREHFRALPIARTGMKAMLYTKLFKPAYNLLPQRLAESLAYKFSVTAAKN